MNDSYSEWPKITTTGDYYDNDVRQSYSMMVVSMFLFSITCVLGIPGNAFVIWIVGVKMKKTVTTIWYVNLAVADLLCCLHIPIIMSNIVFRHMDYDWPCGLAMCKIYSMFIHLNMIASTFTLTLISLDRFTGVICPIWARSHKTIVKATVICGLVWFVALLLCIPYLIFQTLVERNNRTFCIMPYIPLITIVRAVLGFLIPMLVITVCSLLIARRLSFTRFKSQKSLLVMVGVVIAFFVCWMPYHYMHATMDGKGLTGVRVSMFQLSTSLALMNSCLNPLLYAFMGTEFKKSVKVSLRHIFENAFREDTT